MAKDIFTLTTTISSGATTGEIPIRKGYFLSKVKNPASISSTTMKISEGTDSGGTFTNIQDGLGQYGTVGDVTFTVAASATTQIPPALTVGLTYIKLVFGSSETAKTYTLYMQEL